MIMRLSPVLQSDQAGVRGMGTMSVLQRSSIQPSVASAQRSTPRVRRGESRIPCHASHASLQSANPVGKGAHD